MLSERRPLAQEWFTASELAEMGLPGVPRTPRAVRMTAERLAWRERMTSAGLPAARERAARGGGWEYHYSLLPMDAVRRVVTRFRATGPDELAADAPDDLPVAGTDAPAWAALERRPAKHRETAQARALILDEVAALIDGGWNVQEAVVFTAERHGVGKSSVFGWRARVDGYARAQWFPVLAPKWAGGGRAADCTPAAWDWLVADYLRLGEPSFDACFRRLERAAAEHGWQLPAARTLRRRIEREFGTRTRILAREGKKALRDRLPTQRRSVADVPVMGCIVADGHKWDVFVDFPGVAKPQRPVTLVMSDLRTRKILAWRTGETEHAGLVRLCLGDVVEHWGIPEAVLFDNGRAFASKWITGQAPHRKRFKIRHEEPQGLCVALGIQIHWAMPYSGRSKPIERSFRDLTDEVSRNTAFDGAYTGRSPMHKPENYGSRSIPLADFEAVLAREIAHWNARVGRRTEIAAGRSFDEAFAADYDAATVAQASAGQRQYWLLAGDDVTVQRRTGEIHLYGNVYGADRLLEWAGRKVTVRFDPANLHLPLRVYDRVSGELIDVATCIEKTGFFNSDKARDAARHIREMERAEGQKLAAGRRLTAAQAAGMLPDGVPADVAAEAVDRSRRVVRAAFGRSRGGAQAAAVQQDQEDVEAVVVDFWDRHERGLKRVAAAEDEEGGAA